ncbi:hypothetical protein [Nostoc sp.]|uniref:hypothetical protein n=1 Tax=Nostoc sp. TaxID=1180 RepID=UPI002FFBFDE8
MIRAKFTCQQNTLDQETQTATVVLTPSISPIDENLTCWKATPSGEVTLQMTNIGGVASKFHPGEDYYADFTPV